MRFLRLKAAKTVCGVFVRRVNRFLAEVEVGGKLVSAHLPNSGRLTDLLVEGAIAYLSEPKSLAGRKTHYHLFAVEVGDVTAIVDARLSSSLVAHAIESGLLSGLRGYSVVAREKPFGEVRVDLLLQRGREAVLVEVKCVTLVEDGVALFPDVPTERGKKHLRVLLEAARRGERACVVFSVQRSDAKEFSPNQKTDPEFAKLLAEAAEAGVEIFCTTSIYRPAEGVVEVFGDMPSVVLRRI